MNINTVFCLLIKGQKGVLKNLLHYTSIGDLLCRNNRCLQAGVPAKLKHTTLNNDSTNYIVKQSAV